MDFGILGPFEWHDASGREVKVPTGRERALLVVLLLHRGEVVSTDALVDALWGEQPPATAAKALHVYVSHLRRLTGSSRRRPSSSVSSCSCPSRSSACSWCDAW